MASRSERKALARRPYAAVRQDFIAAWNGGGEQAAAELLAKQKSPSVREIHLRAFGEVRALATKVQA